MKELKAIDLGLSVKWGSLNIGASEPADIGYLFAWAETKPKSLFRKNNYKWFKECKVDLDDYDYRPDYFTETGITKYNCDRWRGRSSVLDFKSNIEVTDDVAKILLGGAWRMPTRSEYAELIKMCEWKMAKEGWQVISKINQDMSILFPYGCLRCWSSTLNEGHSDCADALYIDSDHLTICSWPRYAGLPVRPVADY